MLGCSSSPYNFPNCPLTCIFYVLFFSSSIVCVLYIYATSPLLVSLCLVTFHSVGSSCLYECLFHNTTLVWGDIQCSTHSMFFHPCQSNHTNFTLHYIHWHSGQLFQTRCWGCVPQSCHTFIMPVPPSSCALSPTLVLPRLGKLGWFPMSHPSWHPFTKPSLCITNVPKWKLQILGFFSIVLVSLKP